MAIVPERLHRIVQILRDPLILGNSFSQNISFWEMLTNQRSRHQTQSNSHSHLVHSVRVAFGMTPIHPPSSGPSSYSHGSSTHSHSSLITNPSSASIIGKLSLGPQYPHPHLSAYGHPAASHPIHSPHSVRNSPLHSPSLRPGSPSAVLSSTGFGFGFSSRGPSRAGSPPITLAPLRLPSKSASDAEDRNIPGIQEATDAESREAVHTSSNSADDVEMATMEANKDVMQVDAPEDAGPSIANATQQVIVAREATKPMSSSPRVVHPGSGVSMGINSIPLSPQLQTMVA